MSKQTQRRVKSPPPLKNLKCPYCNSEIDNFEFRTWDVVANNGKKFMVGAVGCQKCLKSLGASVIPL